MLMRTLTPEAADTNNISLFVTSDINNKEECDFIKKLIAEVEAFIAKRKLNVSQN